MSSESLVRVLAGSMILASVALAHWHSPYWLWLTAYVGFKLLQNAFTGFCPPTLLLTKFGWIDRSTGRIRRPRVE
jgi:hypothetical protein